MKAARIAGLGLLVTALALGAWWVSATPPNHFVIAPAYTIPPIPTAILEVKADGDPIADTVETIAAAIPGYDDVVLQEHLGRAFVTARDGWIWKVDLESGEAERFVDAPLMASGANLLPGDDNTLCFCAMYLYQTTYPPDEQVGLYRLDLTTKEIEPIVLRVPNPPAVETPTGGNQGTVFTSATEQRLAVSAMTDENSRPINFCNDFAVSSDGKRFYFSEPFPYPGASMGGGAVGEAITLGRNGRLWNYDVESDSAGLVAQNYTFIDGVLLENGPNGREESVLVTETVKFRILRLHLTGDNAGSDEVVWEGLPGMPDALDRAPDGRIWVGMIKQRSGLITWAHANPWIKPLMLRLPIELLPVPTVTAVLALNADASKPLWYTEHVGTHVHDIAAATPGASMIYLANMSDETPGLHRIPNPIPNTHD